MATNKIIVYRGGGYDGCFWEPNAFMFGPNKEFIDLGSQGRHAIKDMETATAKYKEIKGGFGDKDEAIYDVFSKKQMVSLCEDYASVYLRKFVAEALQVYDNVTDEKILKRLQLGFYCSKCKCCITDVEEVHFVNVQSFGGIMIAATDMLCNNCYDNGTCYDCREEGNDDEDSY